MHGLRRSSRVGRGGRIEEGTDRAMKHVRIVTRQVPIKAFWWQWFGPAGTLKTIGKPAIQAAFDAFGAIDPTDASLYPDW